MELLNTSSQKCLCFEILSLKVNPCIKYCYNFSHIALEPTNFSSYSNFHEHYSLIEFPQSIYSTDFSFILSLLCFTELMKEKVIFSIRK